MVIYLQCSGCSHVWRCRATFRRSHCPECGQRAYVPVSIAQVAEDRPGELLYDLASRKLSAL
jgi:predicted  nucleic acid-binding Zn-ribbon protein